MIKERKWIIVFFFLFQEPYFVKLVTDDRGSNEAIGLSPQSSLHNKKNCKKRFLKTFSRETHSVKLFSSRKGSKLEIELEEQHSLQEAFNEKKTLSRSLAGTEQKCETNNKNECNNKMEHNHSNFESFFIKNFRWKTKRNKNFKKKIRRSKYSLRQHS